MSGFVDTVLFFVIFNIVGLSDALVKLPQVAENDILNTENIIRGTTNKLFTSIKLKGVKENPKLKQYGLIHNYFVSLTLKDYKNLKEIAGLTRTDKKTIANSSINFIDLLNEILNEDSLDFETKSNTSLFHAFEDEILNYIEDYSHNLTYLKQKYGDNSPRVDINKGIINILENDEHFLNKTDLKEQENSLPSDYDNLLNDNEFWVPDKSFRRIYQGQRTKIKYFPFMASVQLFNTFQCGGSIIKDDLVITAASCLQLAWNNRLFRENPSFLSVRIGSNYYNGGGETLPVLEVFFYPTYNPKNLRNNIAIMRLTRKIKFKVKRRGRVKKIDIDRKDSPLPMTFQGGVTIVGWGAKAQNSIVHSPWDNKLAFAVLDVYMLKDCQDTYSTDYVTDLNFCAGFISKGGGACSRDVGGPGIVSGVLTGIVSFGSPICGTPDAPTVFTKVGYYADWIEGIMEKESPFIKKRTTLLTTLNTIYSAIYHRDRMTTPTPIISVPNPFPALETTVNPEDKIFKQFLKTMFDSKEIDDYLNFVDDDKDVAEKNAAIIGIRQEQLSQLGPYVQNGEFVITPIEHEDMYDTTEPFSDPTPGTVGDESFKAIEYSTKTDDIQIFNSNNDVEDEPLTSSQDNIELNNQIDTEEDVESRKELENNIMKLIDNVNLKEKIAQAAKKDSTILDKDQDLDNTIMTLLYMSDSENERQQNGMRLASGNNQIDGGDNQGTYVVNEEERMSEDAEANEHLEEDTDNMYDHQELRLDDETVETREEPDNEVANENENLKKDSKAKSGNFDDIFSKKVLFDILSEVIDYQSKNKTVKTT